MRSARAIEASQSRQPIPSIRAAIRLLRTWAPFCHPVKSPWYNAGYMARNSASKRSEAHRLPTRADAGAFEDRAIIRRDYYADRFLPLQNRQYVGTVLGLLAGYEEQRLSGIRGDRDTV